MADSEHTSSSEAHLKWILERIAGLMQEAFLKFCENIWCRNIDNIEGGDNEVVVYCRPEYDNPFMPFDDSKTRDLKNAILAHTRCDGAFMRMEELFKKLVYGMQMP